MTLIAGPVAPGTSSFTANPPRVLAGSGNTSKLTFTAQDAHNNPVTGIASKLKFIVEGTAGTPAPGDVDVSAITEIGTTGVYEASLGGTRVGTYTVTPEADSVALDVLATTVELYKPIPPVGPKIEVSKDKVFADDVDNNKIIFTMVDDAGLPISGIADQIVFLVKDDAGQPATDITLSTITEEGSTGVYSAMLSGTTLGKLNVSPQVKGVALSKSASFEMLTTEINNIRNDYGWNFPITATSKYPTTGFVGAKFTVQLANNANPNDYDWTSNQGWMTSQGAGAFQFTSAPTGSTSRSATIMAKRKGSNVRHTYIINNTDWFDIGETSVSRSPAQTAGSCKAKGMEPVNTFLLGYFLTEWAAVVPPGKDDFFLTHITLVDSIWSRQRGSVDNPYPLGETSDPTRLLCVY